MNKSAQKRQPPEKSGGCLLHVGAGARNQRKSPRLTFGVELL